MRRRKREITQTAPVDRTGYLRRELLKFFRDSLIKEVVAAHSSTVAPSSHSGSSISFQSGHSSQSCPALRKKAARLLDSKLTTHYDSGGENVSRKSLLTKSDQQKSKCESENEGYADFESTEESEEDEKSEEDEEPEMETGVSFPDPGYMTPTAALSAMKASEDDKDDDFDVDEDFHTANLDKFALRFQEILTKPSNESFSRGIDLDTQIALHNLNQDFLYAAKTYGRIIITEWGLKENQTIRPADIGGSAGGLKFKVQNILFKFPKYHNNYLQDLFPTKIAGHELKGLQSYFNCNVSGICLPFMALVDYRGFRLIATSELPISNNTLVYGSSNFGKKVVNKNRELTEKMRDAAAILNIKPHLAGSPNHYELLYSPVDLEGHLVDKQFWLCDFSRVMPPENTRKGDNLIRLLRPEFVKSYKRPLCSDAYSNFIRPIDVEHNKEVDEATNYLHSTVIPQFAQKLPELLNGQQLHEVDLSALLHSHGINVRHIGQIMLQLPLTEKTQKTKALLVIETVARVFKNDIRYRLRKKTNKLRVVVDDPHRRLLLHLLNLVFGSQYVEKSKAYWEKLASLLPGQFRGIVDPVSKNIHGFSCSIRNFFATHFSTFYSPPPNYTKLHHYNGWWLLLRRVLQMKCVKLNARCLAMIKQKPNEIFSKSTPFIEVDLAKLPERVKHLSIVDYAYASILLARGSKLRSNSAEAASDLLARAVAKFDKALSSNSNSKVILRDCASALTKLAEELKRAGKDTPNSIDVLIKKAQTYLERALIIDQSDKTVMHAYAYFLQRQSEKETNDQHEYLLDKAECFYLKSLEPIDFNVTFSEKLLDYLTFLQTYRGDLETAAQIERLKLSAHNTSTPENINKRWGQSSDNLVEKVKKLTEKIQLMNECLQVSTTADKESILFSENEIQALIDIYKNEKALILREQYLSQQTLPSFKPNFFAEYIMSNKDWEVLNLLATITQFDQGDIVISKDKQSDTLLIVKEGMVKVMIGNEIFTFLKRASVIPLFPLPRESYYVADSKVVEVQDVKISDDVVNQALLNHPLLGTKLSFQRALKLASLLLEDSSFRVPMSKEITGSPSHLPEVKDFVCFFRGKRYQLFTLRGLLILSFDFFGWESTKQFLYTQISHIQRKKEIVKIFEASEPISLTFRSTQEAVKFEGQFHLDHSHSREQSCSFNRGVVIQRHNAKTNYELSVHPHSVVYRFYTHVEDGVQWSFVFCKSEKKHRTTRKRYGWVPSQNLDFVSNESGLLRGFPLPSATEWESTFQRADRVQYQKHDTIISSNAQVDAIYYIQEGYCEVKQKHKSKTKNDVVIGPGQIFGHTHFLFRYKPKVDVVAASSTVVIFVIHTQELLPTQPQNATYNSVLPVEEEQKRLHRLKCFFNYISYTLSNALFIKLYNVSTLSVHLP